MYHIYTYHFASFYWNKGFYIDITVFIVIKLGTKAEDHKYIRSYLLTKFKFRKRF